eukprot:g39924.t1
MAILYPQVVPLCHFRVRVAYLTCLSAPMYGGWVWEVARQEAEEEMGAWVHSTPSQIALRARGCARGIRRQGGGPVL